MRYFILLLLLLPTLTFAQEDNNFQVTLGAFFSTSNSGLNYTGPGGRSYDVDFESDLDLSERDILPSIEILYHYHQKHHFYLTWRELHRDATHTYVSDPFEFSLDDELYTIQGGAEVTTTFNVDIARVGYGYSLYQNDKWDVIGSVGLHVMFFEIGFAGEVALCADQECSPETYRSSSNSTFKSTTAPLPDLGFSTTYSINDKWRKRSISTYQLKSSLVS